MECIAVVGGAGALGRAVTADLLARGYAVGAIGRTRNDLRALRLALDDPAALTTVAADGTDLRATAAAAKSLHRRHGPLVGWVNLAGGWTGGTPLAAATVKELERMFATNVRTTFVGCRAALPVLLQQGRGKIVNVGARPGIVGGPSMAAYAAAKAAVLSLTSSMAAEVLHKGVQVNAIVPSTIDTPANRAAMPKAEASRWVSPEAIAAVVAFLLSPASDCISGAWVPVYGRA